MDVHEKTYKELQTIMEEAFHNKVEREVLLRRLEEKKREIPENAIDEICKRLDQYRDALLIVNQFKKSNTYIHPSIRDSAQETLNQMDEGEARDSSDVGYLKPVHFKGILISKNMLNEYKVRKQNPNYHSRN